jgi:hypothetical protein
MPETPLLDGLLYALGFCLLSLLLLLRVQRHERRALEEVAARRRKRA